MNMREKNQEQLKSWLLQRPGHLKTNYNRLGAKFGLSYNDTKEIVQEVKDYLKYKKIASIQPDRLRSHNHNEALDQFLTESFINIEEEKYTELFKKKFAEFILQGEATVRLTPEVTIKKAIPPFKGGNPDNVLIIGDTHIPFEREGYLEHCRQVQERFNCGTVIHIGDVIDNHYSSYHEANPDGQGAGDELSVAINKLQDWYFTFPEVKVCLGNHDQIIQRKAFSSGLSKRWIKGLAEVLQTPNWEYDIEHQINDVIYTHGTGTSGDKAAYARALNRRRSIVSGHLHTAAGITWNVSEVDRIFAMQVGCGIDDSQYSFDYAKAFSKKSIISCGVVLNGGKLPIIIPMDI